MIIESLLADADKEPRPEGQPADATNYLLTHKAASRRSRTMTSSAQPPGR